MDAIFDEVAKKATQFFWDESDPQTGLTKDRAKNMEDKDEYVVASMAATGYALASLSIATHRKWRTKKVTEARALVTLRHLLKKQYHNHGFFFHFVDWETGERMWNSELSSIDTTLLLYGAIVAGETFGGEVKRLADALVNRADWVWMQNGKLDKAPTMGWNPEKGFLDGRWDHFDESLYLHILALGTEKSGKGVSQAAWDGLNINTGFPFGTPGPIFWSQMAFGYLGLKDKKDRQGRDWWANAKYWHDFHIDFCAKDTAKYPSGLFGINASDTPEGYGASNPISGQDDGTITPTGIAAAVSFVPDAATKALMVLRREYGDKIWGRYGFSNALNTNKKWFDKDVIGIDLGMALLAIENTKDGFIWKTVQRHPVVRKGLRKAGYTLSHFKCP
jgi:hypothetical protein